LTLLLRVIKKSVSVSKLLLVVPLPLLLLLHLLLLLLLLVEVVFSGLSLVLLPLHLLDRKELRNFSFLSEFLA
jgi:hypothetical protein